MAGSRVTLQINLAPTDLPHAAWTLPHQLRTWASQVEEIVLTVDLHRSRGRYSEGWSERLPGLRTLIDEQISAYRHARSDDVDYSHASAARLSNRFFGGAAVPTKDWMGAPFYAYFHALASASHRYVLHMDSDMLFGGGSRTWVSEAVDLLGRRDDVLACNPLPGPPTADGSLRSQVLAREPLDSAAFRAPAVSTRIFLLDSERLISRTAPLRLLRSNPLRSVEARLDGHPPFLPAEQTISAAMARSGLIRIDFLGRTPGMWALHPPYRSAHFYERLPSLVADVESGDVPEGQRGYHDVNYSMVDWSDARKSRWQRLMGHIRLIGSSRLRQSS